MCICMHMHMHICMYMCMCMCMCMCAHRMFTVGRLAFTVRGVRRVLLPPASKAILCTSSFGELWLYTRSRVDGPEAHAHTFRIYAVRRVYRKRRGPVASPLAGFSPVGFGVTRRVTVIPPNPPPCVVVLSWCCDCTVAVVTIELDHVAGCGVGPGYIFELDRLHGLCENTGC